MKTKTKTIAISYKGAIYVEAETPKNWEDGEWSGTNKNDGMGGSPTLCLEKDNKLFCLVFDVNTKTVALQATNDDGDNLGHWSKKVRPWSEELARVVSMQLCAKQKLGKPLFPVLRGCGPR